jgi:signal transduction histidine kinase
VTNRNFVVSTAALLVLLCLLVAYVARLQREWLAAIENYEHARLEGSLARSSWYWKRAFESELEDLGACFSTAGGRRSELASGFSGRLEAWRSSTRWPGLFLEAYLVSGERMPRLERFDPRAAGFAPVQWPPELAPLWPTLAALRKDAIAPATSRRSLALRVVTALPALLVETRLWPEGDPGSPDRAWLVIRLDAEYLRRQLLPELTELFFSPPNYNDLDLAVVESSSRDLLFSNLPIDSFSAFGRSDHAFGLVDAGTDGEELPRVGGRPAKGREAFPNWTRPPTAADHAWFRDLWARSYYSGHWHVFIRRGASTVAEEVAAARLRASRSALGALGLILVVVVLVVVLTRRVHRLARDQMEFVASVSHELRSPLAALSAAGDNLADSLFDDPGKLREYGRLIQDETQRLREMVENVLHLARRRSDAPMPKLQPLDVNELVDDTLRRSRRQLEQAGFEVEVAKPERPPRVLGNARALQSALQNLISNALKYGLPARWLRISVELPGTAREVRISVEDRGTGISPRDLRRLFDPFYRGERARAGQIEGSGLGLAVVRGVAEQHGGRIVVESTPGAGSRFTLELPLLEAE